MGGAAQEMATSRIKRRAAEKAKRQAARGSGDCGYRRDPTTTVSATSPPAPAPGDDCSSSPGAVPTRPAYTARRRVTRQPGARADGCERPARLPPSDRSRVKAPRLEMRRASNHCKKKMKKWAVEKTKRQAAARETGF